MFNVQVNGVFIEGHGSYDELYEACSILLKFEGASASGHITNVTTGEVLLTLTDGVVDYVADTAILLWKSYDPDYVDITETPGGFTVVEWVYADDKMLTCVISRDNRLVYWGIE